jgi:hypothetical protein
MRVLICFIFFAGFCSMSSVALACDPHEDCSRCLVSTFGNCQVHGNDPACEIRKAACQVPVVGPAITGPGPLGPGGVLGPGGPGVGPISFQDLRACIANPSGCPSTILSSTVYAQLAPIIDQYIQFLENQGNGRWQEIPDQMSAVIASQYPAINLSDVRFAENINTVHGVPYYHWDGYIYP